jgi:hypothetical protein
MSQTFAGLRIPFLLNPLTLPWSVTNRTQSNRDSSIEQPWQMWRSDAARDALQGASGYRERKVQDARWRLSRGAHGQGNGMWKHGLRSAEVIERRRQTIVKGRALRRAIEELSRRAAGKV